MQRQTDYISFAEGALDNFQQTKDIKWLVDAFKCLLDNCKEQEKKIIELEKQVKK